MKYEVLFDNFVEAVKAAIPRNTKVSAVLTDILKIEKEAVYRRLRKEVPFTFAEIAKVSKQLDFSVDELIDRDTKQANHSNIHFIEYLDPKESELMLMDRFMNLFRQLKTSTNSSACISCKTLPLPLYMNYEGLTRFYLFKQGAMSAVPGPVKRYSEITISPRLRQNCQEVVLDSHYIKATCYILDNTVFSNLANDLEYFESIQLISPAEVQEIKKDILNLIDDIEALAEAGCYSDTHNTVNFYVSSINFENCFAAIESEDRKTALIRTFQFNAISSQEESAFERVKKWMQSLKRVSTLISQSGEQQRITFFNKQRDIVRGI